MNIRCPCLLNVLIFVIVLFNIFIRQTLTDYFGRLHKNMNCMFPVRLCEWVFLNFIGKINTKLREVSNEASRYLFKRSLWQEKKIWVSILKIIKNSNSQALGLVLYCNLVNLTDFGTVSFLFLKNWETIDNIECLLF